MRSDWIGSTIKRLNVQSVVALLYSLEIWTNSTEKRVKERSELPPISAFKPSVPLYSLSLWTMMPKSNFQVMFSIVAGAFSLFFTLLWLCCVLFPLGFSPVTLSDSLQMDVVSAFQSGTSFQGALRRQASNSSQQQHDVTNVSSPTHVALSTTTTTATAANTASATVGCECVFPSSAWDFFLSLLFF